MAMKKLTGVLCGILIISVWVFGSAVQAGAETMNFKLVSMIEKRETVKVTQAEGVIIGVLDRKGLSLFDNGEVATTSCRGTFDTKKRSSGI